MKSLVYLLITIILFGCASKKEVQPKRIAFPSKYAFNKQQFIDFFASIEKKEDLEIINQYRLATLNKISNFESDTIIYYESLTSSDMVIGQINYYSCIYESRGDSCNCYAISVPLSSSLSLHDKIIKKEVKNAGTSGSFSNIVRSIKNNIRLDRSIQGRINRHIIGFRDHGNLLLIVIKIGGIYQFNTYDNFYLEYDPSIEVDPLKPTF